MTKKAASSSGGKYSTIPVRLSEAAFERFVLPLLSMPKRGPKCKISYAKLFNYILRVLYTGMQWKELPIDIGPDGKPEIHYTRIYRRFAQWCDDGSMAKFFDASVAHLHAAGELDTAVLNGDGTNTVAKKGGDGIGFSGHKHQKGEKVVAIVDYNGNVIAPYAIAPVNVHDTVLLPGSLSHLTRIAREVGFPLKGAVLNLDGAFDSKKNRKAIFNRGMKPNIPENVRNRKRPKPGPKRFFDASIHELRLAVERTFAWEDKFKRLLLRFERIQSRHLGFKLAAYALINLRRFCVA
jgi:transposase